MPARVASWTRKAVRTTRIPTRLQGIFHAPTMAAMQAHAEIRLAAPDDAHAIAAMSRDYIEVGLPWGWRAERIARAIRDPETNVAVVGPPGAVTGFGIMTYRAEDA